MSAWPTRARWRGAALLAAATVIAGGLLYGRAVAGRAHFESPPPTPILLDRTGAFLAQFGDAAAGGGVTRTEFGYWPVAALPERIVRATLAAEDRRFWQHPGVDARAVLRAAWQDLLSLRRRSGASTLAMQVARMQAPGPRTLWSKAVEAGTALALTARYGRREVLAQYLRLAPYGNGSHGVLHAARWYFDKPAADLSWAEIALLCALPRAPAAYNPHRPQGLALARRGAARILAALRVEGAIDGAEFAAASAQLAGLSPAPPPARPPQALHAILRLGAMVPPMPARAPEYRLRASLDLEIQRAAAELVGRGLGRWRAAGAQQAAVMVVEPGTGAVLAAVGSGSYGGAEGGAIDFTRAPRSPGSTLKPFLYAAALARGLLDPAGMQHDAPGVVASIQNADARYLGALPPGQALANSRNVPAAALLRRLGMGTGFALLRGLGLAPPGPRPGGLGLGMAIGAMPTSLDRLMVAYTALADGGVRHPLAWFATPGGAAAPARVFPAAAAREVALFLSDPLARLPSFERYGSTEYPLTVAVKTGTSQGFRDAWTFAWSERFLVGAWVGRADAGPMAGLGGADSAAGLVRALLLGLHGAGAGDLADVGFAPPEGYRPRRVCAAPDATGGARCSHTLLTWVEPRPTNTPATEARATETRATESRATEPRATEPGSADPHSAYPEPAGPLSPAAAVRLSVLAPRRGELVWRNPEAPPAADRLLLRAAAPPSVKQVVWYVDGAPFALADPQAAVPWPLQPGEHRFQLGLPLRPERSAPVALTVR